MQKNWQSEFEEFMQGHTEPPKEATARILARVRRDLAPSRFVVGAKIYLLGMALGVASLLICPQLGLAYGPLGHTLHGVFMRFGAAACTALCSAILLFTTTLLVLLCLSREERRVAYRARYLQSLILALSLLGLFLALGASAVLKLAVVWFVGAVLGGVVSYQLSRPRELLTRADIIP